MSYPNQVRLMDSFYRLAAEALASQDYAAKMVFDTAVDLTDGLLKGYPADGPSRLATALETNLERAEAGEKKAWARALAVLTEEIAASNGR